jgi:hypothetical protein
MQSAQQGSYEVKVCTGSGKETWFCYDTVVVWHTPSPVGSRSSFQPPGFNGRCPKSWLQLSPLPIVASGTNQLTLCVCVSLELFNPLPYVDLILQLWVYREENACFCSSCFCCLYVTADMCFHKPFTTEVPYSLLRQRYLTQAPFETRHIVIVFRQVGGTYWK